MYTLDIGLFCVDIGLFYIDIGRVRDLYELKDIYVYTKMTHINTQ